MALGLTVTSVEKVIGSDRDDEIAGANVAEQIFGGDGGDDLNGRGGDDKLFGGLGADKLTGGTGKDTFVFDDYSSAGDFVTDFKRGEDKIAIDLSEFGLASNYKLLLVQGADPVATTTGATFFYETDTNRLWYDADGNGGDEEMHLVATFDKVASISTSDFLFV